MGSSLKNDSLSSKSFTVIGFDFLIGLKNSRVYSRFNFRSILGVISLICSSDTVLTSSGRICRTFLWLGIEDVRHKYRLKTRKIFILCLRCHFSYKVFKWKITRFARTKWDFSNCVKRENYNWAASCKKNMLKAIFKNHLKTLVVVVTNLPSTFVKDDVFLMSEPTQLIWW